MCVCVCVGGGGGGSAGKLFATMFPFYFDMQHDLVLIKLNFNLLTQPQGQSAGKIFATMLLHW